MITVEVCFVDARHVTFLKQLVLPDLATADQAVNASGVAAAFPDISFGDLKLAIFGKPVPSGQVLREGDRVEICRPLALDPMAARRQRAQTRLNSRPKRSP